MGCIADHPSYFQFNFQAALEMMSAVAEETNTAFYQKVSRSA